MNLFLTRLLSFFSTSLSAFIVMLLLSSTLQAQPSAYYPAALSGGNYMHNFYFPPSPSSTPGRLNGRQMVSGSQWPCRAVYGKSIPKAAMLMN